MKTIITAFALFFVAFANAQEKKEPTLYETVQYIENKIKEGYRERNKTNLPTDNKKRDVSFFGDTYSTESYEYDYQYYNEYLKRWQTAKYVNHVAYYDIDFKKLKEVELELGDQNDTYVFVYIRFETEHIRKKKWITNGNYYVKQDEWYDGKTSSFWIPLLKEEGGFDRFKKALFHYKNLLIAEQKQKQADDPFGN